MINTVYWHHGITLKKVEEMTIISAYNYYKQNKTKTAKGLGVSTKTIYTKLLQYGYSKEDLEEPDDNKESKESEVTDTDKFEEESEKPESEKESVKEKKDENHNNPPTNLAKRRKRTHKKVNKLPDKRLQGIA